MPQNLSKSTDAPAQAAANHVLLRDPQADPHQPARSLLASPEAWVDCPAYALTQPATHQPPREPGSVRFAWCDAGLLARFDFTDRCVTTQATRDSQWHYQLGDTAEWFLHLDDSQANHPIFSPYFELYITPNGFRSVLRWTNRQTPGPNANPDPDHRDDQAPFRDPDDFRILTGLTPASTHRAPGWFAECLVPWQTLESPPPDAPDTRRIRTLVGRYDYDQPDLADGPEIQPSLSCFPEIPAVDFHQLAHYATLTLLELPARSQS